MADVRYVVLTPDFKPMQGGIAEYQHHLWDECGKRLNVTIMSSAGPLGNLKHHYHHRAIPAPPFANQPLLAKTPLLWRIGSFVKHRALCRYAQKTVAETDHARFPVECFVGAWSGELTHYWCEALKQAAVRYSIFAYGLEFTTANDPKRSRWLRSDFRAAKRIFACSRGTGELVMSKIGTGIPISVVNPGVSHRPSEPTPDTISKSVGDSALFGKRVVLSLCRLVERKGLDRVLRSVAHLVKRFPDLCYVIAGDGPARANLECLAASLGIQSNIRFLGEVDEDAKWALYDACEFFVMPNRTMNGKDWEGFGIVFLEAAMAGKPSIGGKNAGVSDAIEDGVTGILVNTEFNEGDTLAAMQQLLGNRALCKQMGEAARARARSKFSWDAIGNGFIEKVLSYGEETSRLTKD